MAEKKPKVKIRQGRDEASLTRDLLWDVVAKDYKGLSVLVKPNIGFLGSPGSGVITHCEVVRGVVRFLKDAGAKPFIGDSCIFGVKAEEAFERSGVARVAEEEGVELVDLDRGEAVPFEVPNPMAVERLKVSSYAAQADRIVSVPVMKTHMHAVASLSLKNMKGCLHQREKIRFHHLPERDRFQPWHGQKTLDRAIADLASVLYPDLAVVDGIVAMEGLGPSLGEPKPLGLVLASEDPIAADMAALFLMGFERRELPHLVLSMIKRGCPERTLDDLDFDRERFTALRSPFKRAIPEDISAQFPQFLVTFGESCSACDATVMAFLDRYGVRYVDQEKTQIVVGKYVDPQRLQTRRCILLGNCTAKLKGLGLFIEGCPPVPSDLLKTLEALG